MNARKLKSRKRSASQPAVHEEPEVRDKSGSAAWHREGVESIVVAIVLALLFRSFEAEAFVIPTGSMAPTLQGRHKDVVCPECRFRYRSGANLDTETGREGPVVATTCPMCRYQRRVNLHRANDGSFSGDRILVNKFAYQFGEPRRWDVIVFKFPGNAKQNYIKRLVGLPNETLRIKHGDVYARPATQGTEFTILRKPLHKLRAMLQLVHDTDYIPGALISAGWPAPWQSEASRWSASEDQRSYRLEAGEGTEWLRYRHAPPAAEDWDWIGRGVTPSDMAQRRGELISDFYAYNAYRQQFAVAWGAQAETGWHWVGDLALDCTVKIESNTGTVWLDLVEGGSHYTCQIDVESGIATATIDGEEGAFQPPTDADPAPTRLTAQTPVTGAGKYRLEWFNVDNQVRLAVNGKAINFMAGDVGHPGHYLPPSDVVPRWTPDDPGDLLPAGIGGAGVQMDVGHIRLLRDIYYIADRSVPRTERLFRERTTETTDYRLNHLSLGEVARIFRTPERWSSTPLFASRAAEDFQLGPDQFFPMGDNSPQSKDARLWGGRQESLLVAGGIDVEPFIRREMLIGKAFYIYWPHGWNVLNLRFPVIPNIARMGRIR
jgi:signal peptidase I